MKYTLLDEIIESIKELGGHCYYKDLYLKITERNNIDFTKYDSETNWKASIRAVIERNSSDSKVFKGNDIFYSVEGIGKGHWGIRTESPIETEFDFTNDDEGFIEGKQYLKTHLTYERNHYIKTKAKESFKITNGRLFCEICGFDFNKIYGEVGKDFIEAHHSIPVSEMKKDHKTTINDFVMLCSNCHSMIHRKRPWLDKDKIASLIAAK